MKLKWYFSTLLVILAVFGVCQEQAVAPNQEIVLQFSNNDNTSSHAQHVIAGVKQQLQSVDAENIQVSEDENGRLKITYFSNEAIATIKEQLSSGDTNTFDFTSIADDNKSNDLPSRKNLEYYNFDIFEIQNNSDSHSGFGGKYIVEHKQELDRSSNPNLQPYSLEVDNKYNYYSVKAALKANSIIAIAIDNTSYNIPEVRAGPAA